MEFHVIELPTKLKENASDILKIFSMLLAFFVKKVKKENFQVEEMFWYIYYSSSESFIR